MCDIRKYLNGEFYNSFSETDRSRIKETNIENLDNQWDGTNGGNPTTDKIFFLSIDEVIKYFGDSGYLQKKQFGPKGESWWFEDQFNSDRQAKFGSKNAWWWLRSPGYISSRAAYIAIVRLMQYCKEAGADGVVDIDALKNKLLEQVKHSITKNTAEWETGYICKPSQFFNSCDSVFYADNKELAEFECDYIIKTQLEDGSWSIPWGWAAYPEEWAVSKNWWKGNGAVLNMLYLKGMGRL